MLARLATAALVGLTAHPVGVEVDIGRGLPAVTVVGLGGTAVLEARDRLRAAFGNTGYEWPDRRITVSLPPADLAKQGSGFDLAKVNLGHVKIRPWKRRTAGWPSTPASPRTGKAPASASNARRPTAGPWPSSSAGRLSPSTPTTTCPPTPASPAPATSSCWPTCAPGPPTR
jgi:hypothetical protein